MVIVPDEEEEDSYVQMGSHGVAVEDIGQAGGRRQRQEATAAAANRRTMHAGQKSTSPSTIHPVQHSSLGDKYSFIPTPTSMSARTQQNIHIYVPKPM